MIPIRDINPTRITPVFTIAIILINVAVYFFWEPQAGDTGTDVFFYENAAIACELTTGQPLTVEEANRGVCDDQPGQPINPGKNIWLAVLVSMFLHGSLFHILGNMWFLWIFGNNVEEAYGNLGYVAMYLASGLIATAAFVLSNPNSVDPLIGASGAIAGILGAYLVLFPTHQVLSLFFVFFVPIPAVVFLGFWFISQFGIQDISVAWQAHVGGFLFGVLLTLPLRGFLLRRIELLHAAPRYR